MIFKRICASLLAGLLLVFCGCERLAEKFYPETTGSPDTHFIPVDVEEGSVFFRDFDGNGLTLKKEPEKVVSLSVVATEIICGIGAGRYITALDEASSRLDGAPISAEVIPYFGVDVQKITELSPDLVFYSTATTDPLAAASLKNSGLTLIRIPDSGGIAAAEANIRFISSLLFKDEIGEKVIASMRAEYEKTRLAAEIVGVRKTVYIEGMSQFIAYGGDTIVSELCALAGADNVFADVKGTKNTNAAEVSSKDPQLVIVLSTDPGKYDIDKIRKREGIDQIYASRTKSVFALDYIKATRPTQNIISALRDIEQIMKNAK